MRALIGEIMQLDDNNTFDHIHKGGNGLLGCQCYLKHTRCRLPSGTLRTSTGSTPLIFPVHAWASEGIKIGADTRVGIVESLAVTAGTMNA